jgi:hypothetical protein
MRHWAICAAPKSASSPLAFPIETFDSTDGKPKGGSVGMVDQLDRHELKGGRLMRAPETFSRRSGPAHRLVGPNSGVAEILSGSRDR